MQDSEFQELLKYKPELPTVKDAAKYAIFLAFVQRGWKAVGVPESGVLTKNNFVLTIYKSDASKYRLKHPSKYLVPAALSCFDIPRVSWVLERYNKVYATGKVNSIWAEFVHNPEEIQNAPTLQEFLNTVDKIACMQEIELQSIGQQYSATVEKSLSFSVHKGDLSDTNIFMSMVDFNQIKTHCAYKIKEAKEVDGERYFVLEQIEPASSIELIIPFDEFNVYFSSGKIVPLNAEVVSNVVDYALVSSSEATADSLPNPIQELNLDLNCQTLLGRAINERLFVLPMLQFKDIEQMQLVYSIIKVSHENLLLMKLPHDAEQLKVILNYARAGYSVYNAIVTDNAQQSAFELQELLENASYEKEQMSKQYNIAMVELAIFLKTFYFHPEFSNGARANYTYLQMLKDNNIMRNVCDCALNNTIYDSTGVIYLHKVYFDFDVTNEIRSFFFEEGMEQIFEHALSESTHLSFNWRDGFGLDFEKRSLIRVPSGYKLLDSDRNVLGYMLKVNNEVFTYGKFDVKA